MGFFKTKDPKTGEPRLGAGVYLIICLLMIGGVVLWNVRQHAHEPGFAQEAPSEGPRNPTNVAPVAEAAANHVETTNITTPTGIQSQAKSARGADLNIGTADSQKPAAQADTDNLDTIQNTVELLRQNQEKVEREKADAVAQATARAEAEAQAKIDELKRKQAAASHVTSSAESPAARETNIRGTGRPASSETQNINVQGLIVYDSNRDVRPQPVQRPVVPTGFDTNNFLPRGTMFPIYILSTVQTVNQEDIVVMGVAENVIFQHKIQIPFGTRLLGSAAASNFEDRVMINLDTILYPDGKELPISAFLKDASDLSSGVRGYYIPQPFAVQITPYVSEFIDLWTQAAAQRFSGINETVASGTPASGQVFQGALQESSDLIQQQAQKIQQRLDRRYPEKVVIPIGTKAFAELRTPLDLTRARIGGSRDNHQPILPGFQNNPIDPNGKVETTANYGIPPLASNTTPAPAPLPAPATPQNQAAAAQELQTYSNALQQLQTMQNQLNGASNSNPPPPASSVNWPKGDIE